jgi:DNA-binding GntR family transcriptional regulator
LYKEKILQTLKDAGVPLPIEELAQRVGMDITRLRVMLFRLLSEGKVESRQRGTKLVWTLRVKAPAERRYEKLLKKVA